MLSNPTHPAPPAKPASNLPPAISIGTREPHVTNRAAIATVLGTAVLASIASGCSSHATADTGRTRETTATAHPTGAELAALLPTTRQLAAGLSISAASDTAGASRSPAHLPDPALPNAACDTAADLSAQLLTADRAAAWATEVIDDNGSAVRIVLAATNPGGAAEPLAEARAFATRCAETTAEKTSGTQSAGLALDTFARLGDDAIRIRVTDATAQPEVVLVRVGDELAAVSDPNLPTDEAATISIARYLADRLDGKPA